MADTREPQIRRQVIDRCLSSGRGYTMKQMMNECNKALIAHGHLPVTALNTIRTDLRCIDEQYESANRTGRMNKDGYVIIDVEHSGRNKYYRYWKKGFSIFHSELNSEEIAGLAQAVNILSHFQGMPNFEWVDEMAERFKDYTGMIGEPATVVSFDENPDLVGKDHFTVLFNAICSETPLILTYRNFYTNQNKKLVVHPYYLKQYNKRWFLFAWNETEGFLANYAFDRIVEIENSHNDFIPNKDFVPDDYFEEMVGVSRYMDSESTKITLWVNAKSWPYIKTKPLHGSQRIVEENEEGATITIDVILNYELEQLLLSYGEAVKILSPASFQEKMKERIEKMLLNYR